MLSWENILFVCSYILFQLVNHTIVFCPNDKVHPARKLRIEKVIDHGGEWQKEWSTEVDYVVLEKILCYNDLIKWLKLEAMPASHKVSYTAVADVSNRTTSLSWARSS
jgi:hypothetical protein